MDRILLVEDNPDDELLTLRGFAKFNLGNKIDVVRDGLEALDYLFGRGKFAGQENAKNLSLILLDLKLPKLSGLEVLKEIKSDPHLKVIPVVALTTSKEDGDIQTAYTLGVNSYVIKPVDLKSFMDAIHQVGAYWFILNQKTYEKKD